MTTATATTRHWKVTGVELTKQAETYGRAAAWLYDVEGINHYTGERFFWRVNDLSNPEYDLSGVEVPPLA